MVKLNLKSPKIYLGPFFLITFFIFLIFKWQLNVLPNGFFCDEAVIGVRGYELLKGNLSNFISIFFYRHFNYINGSLPVLSNLPFILLLGLNEYSLRLSSVFFSLLSLITLFFILKKQKTSFKSSVVTIIIFAFTPIFFHISRINFGHLPSLFFMLLGYLFYLYKFNIFSGISFGIGLYGYSGYVLTIPFFIIFLIIKEIIKNKFSLSKYISLLKLIISFIVLSLPLLFMIFFNKEYLLRLKDKDQQKNKTYIERVISLKNNYLKYYSYDYLFSKGEIDMPGSFVTRHSVKGQGELYKISVFFLITSFIFFILDKNRLMILPFILMFLFYPLPDIITTSEKNPPYSFSIFSSIIFFPFLISYTIEKILYLLRNNNLKKIFLLVILFICFYETNIFLRNYFINYSSYSSDYWGWQSGPNKIISYFKTQSNNYDELYMTGSFNAPEIFLKFYDPEYICSNCFIGGIDKYNKNKKQLFAITPEDLNKIDLEYSIKKTIYYPNNNVAFQIIDFSSNSILQH